jgi:hypothetical protein
MSEEEFQSKFGFSKMMIKFPGNGFCKFEKDDYTYLNGSVFECSSRKVNDEYTMNKECNTNISMWFESSILQPLNYYTMETKHSFNFCRTTKWKNILQKYHDKYSVESINLKYDEAWNKISNVIEDLDVKEFKPITTTKHKALDLYIDNNVRLLVSCESVSAELQQALWDLGVNAFGHRHLIGVKDCVAFISNRKGIETTQITLVELDNSILEQKFHNLEYDNIDSAILCSRSVSQILRLLNVVKRFRDYNYMSPTKVGLFL